MASAEEHSVPHLHILSAAADFHHSYASAAEHSGAADRHQGVANEYQGKWHGQFCS